MQGNTVSANSVPASTISRWPAAVLFVVVAMSVSGCNEGDESTKGFCKVASRDDSAFAALDPTDRDALDRFRRLAREAPNDVRDDLLVVVDADERLLDDPMGLLADSAALDRVDVAVRRVDTYLEDTCGLDIPERPDSIVPEEGR